MIFDTLHLKNLDISPVNLFKSPQKGKDINDYTPVN